MSQAEVMNVLVVGVGGQGIIRLSNIIAEGLGVISLSTLLFSC